MFNTIRALIQARPTPGERPDPTPIHVPGLGRPLTLQEEMKRYIREEVSRVAIADGSAESFDESNDFSVRDDEGDLLSEYSVHELTPEQEASYALEAKEPESGTATPEPDEKIAVTGSQEQGHPSPAKHETAKGPSQDPIAKP